MAKKRSYYCTKCKRRHYNGSANFELHYAFWAAANRPLNKQ